MVLLWVSVQGLHFLLEFHRQGYRVATADSSGSRSQCLSERQFSVPVRATSAGRGCEVKVSALG